jgi:hypothetical protein
VRWGRRLFLISIPEDMNVGICEIVYMTDLKRVRERAAAQRRCRADYYGFDCCELAMCDG